MTPQGEESTNWSRATAAASLTAQAAPGSRHRFLRRLFARFARPYLSRQDEFNHAVLGSLVEVRDDLAAQLVEVRRLVAALGETVPAGVRDELAAQRDELVAQRRALDATLPVVEHQGYAIDAVREVIDDQLLERQVVSQEIDLARQQAFARFHDGLGVFRRELGELSRLLSGRADAVERRLSRAEQALTSARARLVELSPGTEALAETASITPLPTSAPPAPGSPAGGRFSQLYASFEDAFRGSEGLIKERVAGYLTDVEPCRGKGPILDVGCGRGDWLEMLKEAGLEAYGIEVSTGYADRWKLGELDVRVVDVSRHLASLPKGSLAAVTALQVVEHLDTDQLLELLELSFEALQPGGLLVLETPNPENVTVGANTFYLDPTHDRPIPAGLLAFLVEAQGFEDVEVRYLRWPELHGLPEVPRQAPWADDLAPVRDVVDRLVFGAQDYAVVARRG